MNDQNNNLTRRSFVKKSNLLALGIASASLFSGLAVADTGSAVATSSASSAASSVPGGVSCKKLSGTGTACSNKDSGGWWHCTCDTGGGDAICADENTPGGAWVWCRDSDNDNG